MKKALLVIDFQRDFVDGALGFAQAAALDRPICDKIRTRRAQGAEIIFTFDTHRADYLHTREGQHLPVEHCLEGSSGWQLYGETASLCEEEDLRLTKPGFGSLELAELLRERGYDEVELVGLVSYICVLSNAVLAKAALPEAIVRVDAACTGGADPALHRKALELMQTLHIQVDNL